MEIGVNATSSLKNPVEPVEWRLRAYNKMADALANWAMDMDEEVIGESCERTTWETNIL